MLRSAARDAPAFRRIRFRLGYETPYLRAPASNLFENGVEKDPFSRPECVQPKRIMRIQACLVPDCAKIQTLSRHFGPHVLALERRVHECMSEFSSDYCRGSWRLFELDNGGFYMSPPGEVYELCIFSRGFRGLMSADAAGITVCLFAYSYLSFEITTDAFFRHFLSLRDFAMGHAETRTIFHAVD